MRIRFLRMVLSLTLIGLLVGGVVGTGAQDSATTQADTTAAPPRIIDVWPLPGVELAPDDTLTITFDWPMDQASVEAAFSITPALDGLLEWADTRTLVFRPAQPWPLSTEYLLQIRDDARSEAGVPLAEAYDATLTTRQPVALGLVEPGPESTDVPTDARITISFNRPMVALTATTDFDLLPAPLTLSPAVEGVGEWVNTSIYVFTPARRLAPGTAYTVTLAEGLTAADGTPLDAETLRSWRFTTSLPQITGVNLAGRRDVRPDVSLVIGFTDAMDRASTEAAIRLYPSETADAVAGTFTWHDNDTRVTFTPSERLALATIYSLEVFDSAHAAGNPDATLSRPLADTFTTLPLPGVAETFPRDGRTNVNIAYSSDFTIVFHTAINPETLRDRIVIDPAPETFTPSIATWDARRVIVAFPMALNTTYTVTLKAGVEDLFGNAIPDDYTFTFTTDRLPDRAYPVITGNFMVTNAYREDTRLAIRATGSPEVSYFVDAIDLSTLYSLRFTDYRDYYGSQAASLRYGGSEGPATGFRRFWETTYDSAGQRDKPFEVLLASEEGGQLAPGLYYVSMSAPSLLPYADSRVVRLDFALAVSTATLTVKRSHNEVLVWVTDMQTGQPLPGVTVKLYAQAQGAADILEPPSVLTEGITDADGLYRAPVDLAENAPAGEWLWWRNFNPAEALLIVAEAEGVYGAWYSNTESVLTTTRAHLYTDRPIYRPTEPIYFKGTLRDRLDMTYTPPDVEEVEVSLKRWSETILTQTVPVTAFGTFSGEFIIPQDIMLGEYSVEVAWGGRPFDTQYCWSSEWVDSEDGFYCETWLGNGISLTIAEYRVPEFEVRASAQRPSILQGEPLDVLVSAEYYFGGALADANVDWRLQFGRGHFTYENYSFRDATLSLPRLEEITGSVMTSIDGQALITTTDTAGRITTDMGDLIAAYPGMPLRITAFATVRDSSGQGISARASLTAHPSTVYVGVRAPGYFGAVEQPYTFELVTVTPEHERVAGQAVEVEVVEVRWERDTTFGHRGWVERMYPVTTGTLTTDLGGAGRFSFTPPSAGVYRLRAVTVDSQGRRSSSTRQMYASGRGGSVVYYGRPSSEQAQVTLLSDRIGYRPGDTAQIIISAPFEVGEAGDVSLLIATERAGITRTEVVRLTAPSLTYTLELTEDDAPNIHISAWMVKGTDADNLNPQYASGSLQLDITPVHKLLDVAVTVDGTPLPGETITVNVQVTDQAGQPVVAEVGVKLTDEAVLALMPDNSRPLRQTFYSPAGNSVTTHSSLSALLDALTDAALPGLDGAGGGGGGGGGDMSYNIRENFITTPLWAPHVVTGADGRASVSVTMPDNLTRWQVDARAVTMDTAVGEFRTSITSALPLIVRPAVPRFFTVGDRVELAAVVNNTTRETQVVTARLQAEGVTLADADARQVTIEAGRAARVTWQAVVQDVPGVDLVFFASSESGYTDAARPALRTGPDDTIPVYRYTARDVVGTGGMLRDAGAITEVVSLPRRLEGEISGSLLVSLEPSLAAAAVDGLRYLEAFAHECVEQTVSRFLPNTVTYRALDRLGQASEQQAADAQRLTTEAVERLYSAQNPDGGFGWFRNMTSSPVVTAYALLGLVEARDAGLLDDVVLMGGLIDADALFMMDFAAEYVRAQLRPLDTYFSWNTDFELQALFRYVLAAYGETDLEALQLTPVLNPRGGSWQLTPTAAAYLLMTYQIVAPDDPQAALLVSHLNNTAVLNATGTHWQDTARSRRYWGSNARTTAVVLAALTRYQPDNPLLPGAVRWLMTARRAGHWSNTQETAWSIIALTDWMQASGELNGAYTYAARLNDAAVADGQVTPATVRERRLLRVDVRALLLDEANRVTLARGTGEGALYYSAHLDLNLPADEVEAVSQGLTISREYFNEAGQPTTTVTAGEVVTVRLTLSLTREAHYFTVDDPLPAGLESIDPNLLTSAGANAPRLSRSDSRWYWGYWAFARTELRDARTSLYTDFIRPGTYVYSYQARAVTPGVFQTMPAQAYEFYSPEVFGRTDGGTFTVLARER